VGAIAFTGDRNAPGKKDYTGAFRPEAERFARYYGGRVVSIPLDISQAAQRTRMIAALRDMRSVCQGPVVGFFCHGFSKRIELGFDRTSIPSLVKELEKSGIHDVALYTCSTGMGANGGDGNFADLLRDEMCRQGLTECRVVAHSTAGHTTMNPHKRFFHVLGSSVGGIGGVEVSRSGSRTWRRWRERLRAPNDTLRFQLPRMDLAEIVEEIS
jgi:hypothetical protein